MAQGRGRGRAGGSQGCRHSFSIYTTPEIGTTSSSFAPKSPSSGFRSPLVMKSPQLPASALFCFLLLVKGLGAAPPGRPEAQPPPLSPEHKERVAGDAVPRLKDGSAPEVRAARNSEPQDEGELFQGVDPRALAAVLLQALDRPASPPALGGSQQGPAEEAAEALLTETVRSQTHSLPVPETQASAAPSRPQSQEESDPEVGDPSKELEALASLLQELRDFSPSSAKRQQETAAAETETRTHTLTRVNLESPGPERVWRASWGEFQARVPERAPLQPPAPQQLQARVPESRPLPETHQFGEGVSAPKTHLGEALAPLSKAYQGLGAPFPKARLPKSSLLGGSEAGERLLQQGLAQVEAGRRQAEATRQAAAQEERLADLASDLLLQYLLQGGARQRGLGGRGLQEAEEEREKEREEGEAEQERRGGEGREEEEDEEAAEAEAEAEEAERARQNALLFAEEEDGEAGAEDKRSQEETPGHRRKEAEGAEEGGEEQDDDEEMDPQTIDSLIELSTKLHLPADDVVSIIEEVEEKRKRKKNAPPEPVPPPRVAPAPTHVRSPQPPPPAPAQDELPDWNEVLPPWDREEDEVFPPGPYHPLPNYIRPRTLQPPAASRRRHYHHALQPPRHYPGREAQARRAQEAAEAEERRLQEQEELENYIEHVLLRRP
ncbi:neurosecretory protein VGF isoform X2 [Choloepus didactylus]|uniref:neurosecretory protein VGF isoform X2 n=1 Tax=Choloepus didactylus TaxID=27675 RepID=UPI00189D43D2|nr:neurosecretory protein VGF isoform X2 [Choloepus didactylus]